MPSRHGTIRTFFSTKDSRYIHEKVSSASEKLMTSNENTPVSSSPLLTVVVKIMSYVIGVVVDGACWLKLFTPRSHACHDPCWSKRNRNCTASSGSVTSLAIVQVDRYWTLCITVISGLYQYEKELVDPDGERLIPPDVDVAGISNGGVYPLIIQPLVLVLRS